MRTENFRQRHIGKISRCTAAMGGSRRVRTLRRSPLVSFLCFLLLLSYQRLAPPTLAQLSNPKLARLSLLRGSALVTASLSQMDPFIDGLSVGPDGAVYVRFRFLGIGCF